jgi:hypothetical protein
LFAATRQTRGNFFFLHGNFTAHLPQSFLHIYHNYFRTYCRSCIRDFARKHELIFFRDLIRSFTATVDAHISVSLAGHLSANSM